MPYFVVLETCKFYFSIFDPQVSNRFKFTTKIAEITTTSSHPPASLTSPLPPEPELTEHEKKMKDYYDAAALNMDRDPTCAPIASHLVPPLEKWFWSPYPVEDIKKTIELCK